MIKTKGYNIVIMPEKLGKKTIFIAKCLDLDVSSQGYSYKEAETNIQEAIRGYVKAFPDTVNKIDKEEMPPMLTKIFL